MKGKFAFFLCFLCLLSIPTPASAAAGPVYLNERDGRLHFGNDRVELVLDAGSGYFHQIRGKQTGADHKPANDGVWPFGVTVGTREKPEQMRAEIRADGVQKMTWKIEDQPGGAKRLALVYRVLVDNASRRETGVGLGINIDLAPGWGYFAIRTEIANGGPLWVTSFYAGKGVLLSGDSSLEHERVQIPARGGFERSKFRGMTLGMPTYGWGWSDYSGRQGGIGIGYVNPDGIQFVSDIQPLGSGLELSWRMFDTRGYWHFENMMNDYQKSLRIQPLEPATNYTTGEWLIVPHAGDWHRTADVYRERLLKTFAGDYNSWETLPTRVKNLYTQFGFFIAENSIGNAYPRKVYNKLDTIAPQVRTALADMGLDAQHASVNLVFFQPNVGRYPEFFPVAEIAGGDAGMKNAITELHRMGISYVIGYAHLAYDHPAARNYVLEADTFGTVPAVNPTAGNRACVDNSAWDRLWEKELIPTYHALGFDGVYADEGHFPWGMCAVAGPAHLHGTSAVGILTANTRGVVRLHKLLHQGLGPQSVIMVEGSGDVAGRWADANHAYPDESVAYTLPFKRYIWGLDALTPEPTLSRNVNVALADGYAIMLNLGEGKRIADPAPLRRYVSIRRRLDEDRAPGYPYGFSDTVGLKWDNRDLTARSFRDPKSGITVVSYADAPVDTELELNPAELGFPQLGTQKHRVRLAKDEVDIWIVPAAR